MNSSEALLKDFSIYQYFRSQIAAIVLPAAFQGTVCDGAFIHPAFDVQSRRAICTYLRAQFSDLVNWLHRSGP